MDIKSPECGNTPVKRLGTRTRISSPFATHFASPVSTKTKAVKRTHSTELGQNGEESFLTPSKIIKPLEDATISTPKISQTSPPMALTEREQYLFDLENKLTSISDYSELENSVDMWKTGCKEALLALQTWMAQNEDVKMTCKTLATHLGILNIVKDNFGNDSEIFDDDDDSPPND